MIEQRKVITKKQIVGEFNIIQTTSELKFVDTSGEEEIVLGTQIIDDSYNCDTSFDILPEELHGLANLLWTQEVKDAWASRLPEVEPYEVPEGVEIPTE